jgi:ABC-type transport system substrate-binding protein
MSNAPAARAQSGARPVTGGTAVWGVETEPSTLNPHLNGQAKAKLILRNVYESLLARTPDGGYVLWLATSYSVSEDGRTYAVALREGVTFGDGEKLDAAAVALNFTRLKDPAYSGSISAEHVSHVARAEAADARTLVLTLAARYAPFLDGAAGLEIISPKSFGSGQLRAGGREIAGTGPSCWTDTSGGRRSASSATPPTIGRLRPQVARARLTWRESPIASCRNRRCGPARSVPGKSISLKTFPETMSPCSGTTRNSPISAP